jgi:hypothetical protein
MMILSRFPRSLSALALAALVLVGSGRATAQVDKRIRAPELDGGTGWIGTDENITLKSLRGKVVVFDFWTLC